MTPAPVAPGFETTLLMPLIGFVVSYGVGYLLGSIPFGLILTRLAGLGDIRRIGSGNIGATNVLRTGKKGLAILTLALDALKGAAAVMVGLYFSPVLGMIAAAAALLGHAYPIWLNYKGGKGVATAFGMSCALSLPLGLAIGFTWIVVLLMVRLSSVAALSAALLSPLYARLLDRPDLVPFFGFAAAFVWWRHRKNIRKLMDGTEPPVSFGSSKPPPAETVAAEPTPPIRAMDDDVPPADMSHDAPPRAE